MKQTGRRLTAVIASTGLLTRGRTILRSHGGSIATAGVLVRRPGKALAGAIVSAGLILRSTSQHLSATLTPGAALTAAGSGIVHLAGNIFTAGALTRQTQRRFSATVLPVGGLFKGLGRIFAATIPSAGVLTRIRAVLVSLSASIGSAGVLSRSIQKTVAAALAPIGSLFKSVVLHVSTAGSIIPMGALTNARAFIRQFTGAISSAGGVVLQITIFLFRPVINIGIKITRTVISRIKILG